MVKNGLSDIVLPDMSDNRLTIRVSPELHSCASIEN